MNDFWADLMDVSTKTKTLSGSSSRWLGHAMREKEIIQCWKPNYLKKEVQIYHAKYIHLISFWADQKIGWLFSVNALEMKISSRVKHCEVLPAVSQVRLPVVGRFGA